MSHAFTRSGALPVALVLCAALSGCCRVTREADAASTLVFAEQRFTPVRVVEQGRAYRIEATGRWRDWFVCTDAKGFASLPLQKFFESRRVLPKSRWFALSGVIGPATANTQALDKLARAGTAFDLSQLVNAASTWRASQDGTLYVFANDTRDAYGNNAGALAVRVIDDD